MLQGSKSSSTRGLTTYKQSLRTQIEVGLWGSLATCILFFVSAFVEGFSRGEVVWISQLGCVVGLATVAFIVISSFAAHWEARRRQRGRQRGGR